MALSNRWTSYDLVESTWAIVADVSFFWRTKLSGWWRQKPLKEAFTETLHNAQVFEEWEAAAFQLDEVLGNDLWRQNASSKHYDFRLIYERLQAIIEAREDDDILGLVNLLRSGLVRNLGNITAPRLFNKAYAGTKFLIEDYITQVALAIEYLAEYPTTSEQNGGLTSQAKLDLLHDTRQAFGRSALVLQGGAVFGLCHLGVVKALHMRGLLPRIISGTATGALIAAIVGVHTEDELEELLTADGIDISAFWSRKRQMSMIAAGEEPGFLATLARRIRRFVREGYFLDVKVLEECVKANVGDLTFEEAFQKTSRILNITVNSDGAGGIPSLLNYITAPNVLIWSAATASNYPSHVFTSPSAPVSLLCKDPEGNTHPWSASPEHPRSNSWAPTRSTRTNPTAAGSSDELHASPLARIAELFNVNHFLISQARPYVAPFLQSGDILSNAVPRHAKPASRGGLLTSWWRPLLIRRILVLEVQHRLRQLDALGLLHNIAQRFLVDESVPATGITIVPELHAWDFITLLETPTKQSVEKWILRGERSVWPAINALKIRCAVEVELDRAYQIVRRKKPMEHVQGYVPDKPHLERQGGQLHQVLEEEREKRMRRRRVSSMGPNKHKVQHNFAVTKTAG